MKIIITPKELIDKGIWEEACDMLNIFVYAVAELCMDNDEEITMSIEQAVKLGLYPARDDWRGR